MSALVIVAIVLAGAVIAGLVWGPRVTDVEIRTVPAPPDEHHPATGHTNE